MFYPEGGDPVKGSGARLASTNRAGSPQPSAGITAGRVGLKTGWDTLYQEGPGDMTATGLATDAAAEVVLAVHPVLAVSVVLPDLLAGVLQVVELP